VIDYRCDECGKLARRVVRLRGDATRPGRVVCLACFAPDWAQLNAPPARRELRPEDVRNIEEASDADAS
jgi:hypothetical protein